MWGAREPRCLVPDVREFILEKETDENPQRSASPQLPADTPVRARGRGCGASFSAPPAGRKAAGSGDPAELEAVKETPNEAADELSVSSLSGDTAEEPQGEEGSVSCSRL